MPELTPLHTTMLEVLPHACACKSAKSVLRVVLKMQPKRRAKCAPCSHADAVFKNEKCVREVFPLFDDDDDEDDYLIDPSSKTYTRKVRSAANERNAKARKERTQI